MSDRICIINGRIGTDPERRQAGEHDVVGFRLASTEKRRTGDLTTGKRNHPRRLRDML